MANSVLCAALAVALAACGSDPTLSNLPDGTPAYDAATPLSVAGTVDPGAGSGPVIALWELPSGAYPLYKFGEGSALAGTFTLDLAGAPPAGARMQQGAHDYGVAELVVLPSGQSVPDGIVDLLPAFTGYSAAHALIYRGADDPGTQPAWLEAFPAGVSCGRCVSSGTGVDSYAPTSCTSLAIADLGVTGCAWY